MKILSLETEVLNQQSFLSKKGNLVHLTGVFIEELGYVQVFDNKERGIKEQVLVTIELVNYGGRLNVRTGIAEAR